MSFNVMGLFDHAEEARAAAQDLRQAGLNGDDLSFVAGNAAGGLLGALAGRGVPEEDAHVYAEGVRRGGSLLSVQVADEPEAERAAEIMNRHNAVDIDHLGQEYRQAGWTRFEADAARHDVSAQVSEGATVHTTVTETSSPAVAPVSGATSRPTGVARAATQTTNVEQGGEIRVPVVEEELRVGKRTVEGGAVRVEKRVEETPVQEQVTLRDETVQVERVPVDQPLDPATVRNPDEAFIPVTVEMRERDEVPVVEKQARVVEEVVIDKEVQQRTETIQDTVRRTNVDVEEIPGTTRTRRSGGKSRRR